MSSRTSSRPLRLLAIAAVLVGALVVAGAVPAAAPSPVGDRIGLFSATTTFPAGQPFYLSHGWGVGATEPPAGAGIYEFRLDVDGGRELQTAFAGRRPHRPRAVTSCR